VETDVGIICACTIPPNGLLWGRWC
jgi:hypothetical protein